MKTAGVFAVSLLLAHTMRAESATLRIQETVVIEIEGATAAYTTNPDVADVITTGPGQLSVTGHGAGTTQLMVITPTGTRSFLITVAAASIRAPVRAESAGPTVRYEGRYSSGVARVQNAVDVVTSEGERRSEFHLLHIHDLRAAASQPSDGIASIFYRHITPDHELTLLDDLVNASRMTVSNSYVRGVHLTRDALELHAGYASPAMYDDFFLPVDRRWVAGAGYAMDAGTTRLIPSVYGFFSQREGTAARRGIVGALTAEHRHGESLFARAEIGVSRSLAAAGELRYVSSRAQMRAFLSFKPENFPTLGLADIRGTHLELDATRRATARLSLASHGSYDRLDLGALPQTIGGASVALRYALTERLAALVGADVSTVRTPATSIRTIGLPLSASYEAPRFGFAASYRLLDHSAATRRGDALRLSGHTTAGRFNASVWADRQRHAPTLELIFRDEPGLDLALLRLGITVRTPEDVARALRDNAALVDLGFISGVNVDLTPRRLQAGINLGWLGSGQRSDHFRLLTVYSRDEGIRTTRASTIATLTYSRRILSATDLYGSYSWWQTAVGGSEDSGTVLDVGVRQQFSAMPRFLRRRGTIDGFVFLDPEMRGVRSESGEPLADIAITLDGTRTVRTDSMGAYAFHQISAGPHRIAAQLPVAPRAFFTTPSHAETNGPAHVDFGLVWAAARIDGHVISDAGSGIAGALLSAIPPNGVPITATSDGEGRFVFAVPPGTFRIALAAQSLPAGYAMTGLVERDVTVEADRPQSVSFEVQARRSIGGRAESEVRIESLGRKAAVDANGNFLFRSMPAGTFTLTAGSGRKTVSRTVTLPAQPAMIGNVVLGTFVAGPADAAPPMMSSREAPVIRAAGAFRLQAGAFRLFENAIAARRRIERFGVPAEITRSGALHVVMAGAFASRDTAQGEANRLRTSGIDTIVVGERLPVSSPSSGASASHLVQTGAFRDARNARQLITRLRRSGEPSSSVAMRGLTIVYVGPFATSEQAAAAAERLRRAGFDALVKHQSHGSQH